MDRTNKLIALDIVQLHMLKKCSFSNNLIKIFTQDFISLKKSKYVFIIFTLYTKEICNSFDKNQIKNKLLFTTHIKDKFNKVQELINSFEQNTKLNQNLNIVLA